MTETTLTFNSADLPTPYQNYIYLSRYARWLDDKKRREYWHETVKRYIEFFRNRFPQISDDIYQELYNGILNHEVLPSMRALWTAGKALEKDQASNFNCAYTAINTPRAFSEIFYILLVGCFHPDTKVNTKRGNIKISEINLSDEILTYDVENNQFEYENPIAIFENDESNEQKLELEFDDGTKIRCTEDHVFFTKNRGEIKAKDLTEFDEIVQYGN